MKEKLEESTNVLLEDIKNNLVNKFFAKDFNRESFRKAHTELKTQVYDKYDIAQNDTFKVIDKIITIAEKIKNNEPRKDIKADLTDLNAALHDGAFLDAVKKDIKKNSDNKIFTFLKSLDLNGKTIDDYNNLKSIYELLGNSQLDFRTKELAFINPETVVINENNLKILNAIVENSMQKPKKVEVDDVYYNSKDNATNSLRTDNNAKEIRIEAITTKVRGRTRTINRQNTQSEQ